MGQLIDEEDCEVCVPFDQEWIFTYGDLVTLLLCFFILLFSTCKYETMKFKSLAASFKPLPAGTPFMNEGKDSVVEQLAQQLEESELADDANIGVEEKGVVVSFKASAYFKPDSAELSPKAINELKRFSNLVFLLPNNIKENDYIELGQLGAYGLTFRTQFNGFFSDEIYEVEDKPIMSLYSQDTKNQFLVA